MTAQEAAQAEPRSSQGSVSFDRGMRITGTAWIEAATRPEPRAQRQLVPTDDPQQYLAKSQHRCVIDFQCLSRLARNSLGLARRAAARAETVTSTGGSEYWFKRKDSRVRRLMRLRATALPKVRVAILKPNRG